jgi:hypothetical protein
MTTLTRNEELTMGETKMKTIRLYSVGLVAIMVFTCSQQSFAQPTPIYSSTGYVNSINNGDVQ